MLYLQTKILIYLNLKGMFDYIAINTNVINWKLQ